MSEVKRCRVCDGDIEGERAKRKQTRYCLPCAVRKKKENTLNPLTPEEKRKYMRRYMRKYRRRHPGLSTRYVKKHREKKLMARAGEASSSSGVGPHELTREPSDAGGRGATFYVLPLVLLPLLLAAGATRGQLKVGVDVIKEMIPSLKVLVVEVTSLALLVTYCWQHLDAHWRRGKDK